MSRTRSNYNATERFRSRLFEAHQNGFVRGFWFDTAEDADREWAKIAASLAPEEAEEETSAGSGYTDCACRDCFETVVSDDMAHPDLCDACEEAGCDGEGECQAFVGDDEPDAPKADGYTPEGEGDLP